MAFHHLATSGINVECVMIVWLGRNVPIDHVDRPEAMTSGVDLSTYPDYTRAKPRNCNEFDVLAETIHGLYVPPNASDTESTYPTVRSTMPCSLMLLDQAVRPKMLVEERDHRCWPMVLL